MLFRKDKMDERVRQSMGHWSAIWLGVTQLLLAGVIFFRLYVLNQPDGELRDSSWCWEYPSLVLWRFN